MPRSRDVTTLRAWCSGRGADDGGGGRLAAGRERRSRLQGFAIGRTIWWNPLKAFVDGTLARDAAAREIGANYARFIQVYKAQAS